MLYTGNRIDAAEALRLGLVDHVVPSNQLLARCAAIANEICRSALLAVQKIREAALRGRDMPLADGLALKTKLPRIPWKGQLRSPRSASRSGVGDE